MAWSIRNYNTFVRQAGERFGLNRAQAGQMYRNMSGRIGRPLTGSDLSKHPRIAGQESKRAPRSEAATRAAATRRESLQKRSEAARRGWTTRKENQRLKRAEERKAKKLVRRKGTEPAPVEKQRTIHDAEEWLEYYDDDDDADYEDWEGTPEYDSTK